MIVGIIIGVIVLILIWFIATYNSLVVLRNKKDNEWSQIDVQLKRRADLIPNLVETVKGYAKHESETRQDVVKARNTYVTARTENDKVKASNEREVALTKLFPTAESYPDLKANTNFISLQNDLKETEDKISYARQFYNDAVLTYNNKVTMVPSNIVASIANFKTGVFFEALEKDKEAPQVKF